MPNVTNDLTDELIQPSDDRFDDAEPTRAQDLADRVAMLELAEQDALEAALRSLIATQRLSDNVADVKGRRDRALADTMRLLEHPALGLV